MSRFFLVQSGVRTKVRLYWKSSEHLISRESEYIVVASRGVIAVCLTIKYYILLLQTSISRIACSDSCLRVNMGTTLSSLWEHDVQAWATMRSRAANEIHRHIWENQRMLSSQDDNKLHPISLICCYFSLLHSNSLATLSPKYFSIIPLVQYAPLYLYLPKQ